MSVSKKDLEDLLKKYVEVERLNALKSLVTNSTEKIEILLGNSSLFVEKGDMGTLIDKEITNNTPDLTDLKNKLK